MKKTTLLILMLLSVFVLSSNAQTNIIPARTDVSGFADWTDTGVAGTTYVQLLTASSVTVSPVMNFDSYTGETLNFKARTYGGVTASENEVFVAISTDNGVNWTNLGSRTPANTTLTAVSSFDLSSYSGTQVKVKFYVAGTSNTVGVGIDDVTFTGVASAACTASNLAFAQPTINKLLADAAFTQTATSLNGTTAIAYTSSNTGVANVNEATGEISIVGAGSTIITASQAAGTHSAVDYCAAITTYTVNVASAAPTITVTEISVPDMAAYVGESDTETMNVSGINLTESIALAISGANADQFSLSTNSVAQTAGTATNTVVLIYYTPTATGSHTATLTISSAGATSVTRTLTGSASWVPLAVPIATDATGITNTGFSANWNVVAGAAEYQLDVTTLTVGGTSMPVLSESFVGFTAGTTSTPDGADKGSALDGLMQVNGWTGAKVYQAGGATKLGTSSVLGSLVTPSVNLSGSFNVSFKAMAWSGDSTKVKIYLNDVLVKTVSGLTNDANYTLTPFSVDLTGGTVGSKIKFEGNQAAKGRLFLDDIVISSGGGVAEQPIPGSPFTVIGDNSKSLTGLTESTTYKYTVKAKNANVTSAVSNKITVVTTTGTGIGQLKGELKVYAHNGNVLLTTKAGNVIEIYNAVGQKLVSHKALEGLNTIPMRVSGVIFVKLGNEVAKVIM